TLRVEAAGVCGTDMHIVERRVPVPSPVALGHEIVGVVECLDKPCDVIADGPLTEGDRVLVAPGVECGRCPGCWTRRSCEARRLYGLTMPYGEGASSYGGFSQYLTLVPGSRVYKLPSNLP